MLKKLRKLVAGIVLASLSVGLFPIQVSATSYTVVQNISSSLIKTSNSSNRVDVSDNAALKPAQITVAAWIKMQSPTSPSFQPFVIKSSSGSWNDGYALSTDSSGGLRFWVNAWNAGAAVTPATPYTGRWIRVVGTYDLQNVKLYVNGSLVNTSASYTTAITHSTGNLRFLNDLSTDYALGNISDVSISGAAWSATDVANDYYNAKLPSSVTNRWKCDEGAGTNAVDSVGGLNGTITGLTYSSDTPSKPYSLVNPNLVKNGDFEYAPPFVAATNNSNKYIDGTAIGSTTNDLFKMYLVKNGVAGDSEAQFDSSVKYSGSNSLKISVKTANKYAQVFINATTYYQAGTNPALPSTSYTYSFRMKTNYVSGDSNDGASIMFNFAKADGTASGSFQSTKVKTTTDWTLYTGTFTTAADTVAINVNPRVYGHTGAATLIMDAWFDDVTFRPTTAYQTQNLLQYTQSFDNAYWTKTRASIPASYVTDPFGGTNAQIIHEDNTAGATHVAYRATPGFTGLMTASLYVKASNRSWIALAPNGGSVARYFNVSTGTIGSGGGDLSYGMQYAGNGWYRCWVTYISDGSHLYYYIASASGTVSFNGLDQDSLYIYGAQVERGAQMTPYLRIDATPYNPNGGSIMAQKQNFLAQSNTLNTTWTTSESTVAVDGAGPFSRTTAWSFVDSVNNTTHSISQTISSSLTPELADVRYVVWAKAGGLNYIQLLVNNLHTAAIFNLSAGTVGSVTGSYSSGATASITSVGNGWYKCELVQKHQAATTQSYGIRLSADGTNTSYAGSGTGVYLYNPQVVTANWSGPPMETTLTAFNEGNIYNLAY